MHQSHSTAAAVNGFVPGSLEEQRAPQVPRSTAVLDILAYYSKSRKDIRFLSINRASARAAGQWDQGGGVNVRLNPPWFRRYPMWGISARSLLVGMVGTVILVPRTFSVTACTYNSYSKSGIITTANKTLGNMVADRSNSRRHRQRRGRWSRPPWRGWRFRRAQGACR